MLCYTSLFSTSDAKPFERAVYYHETSLNKKQPKREISNGNCIEKDLKNLGHVESP